MALTFTPVARIDKSVVRSVDFDDEFLADIKEAITYAFANPQSDLSVIFPTKDLKTGFVAKVQAYAKREGHFVFRVLPNAKTDAETYLRFRIMTAEAAEKIKAENKAAAEDVAARRARGEVVKGRTPKPKDEAKVVEEVATSNGVVQPQLTDEVVPASAAEIAAIPAQASPSPAIMPGRKAA